jgi:tetratricopeptide (TPR) repeat protein
MNPEIIPAYLLEQISRGEAVLFLGAGASHGCKSNKDQSSCPNGNDLGKILSNTFLGGKRSGEQLARIADFAIAEAGLAAVQRKIAEIFEPIEPQGFHKIMPRFRWKAIITTNYDRVIEKSYEAVPERMQDPVPIVRNGEMSRAMTTPQSLPIIKLHGCVSQYGEFSSPLVLANEQYVKHSKGRERLATTFQELARDFPVIFCGYQFNDLHIQAILFGLDDEKITRPQFLAINPAFEEIDIRYWAKHRVIALPETFESFLTAIDRKIRPTNRTLSQLLDNAQGSISRWLKVGKIPSKGLQALLSGRLEHVHPDLPVAEAVAERFYRGDSRNWSPIAERLDFSRVVTTNVLSSVSTHTKASGAKLVLVKGHAGTGKSVLLRRVAWDAASTPNELLVFYGSDSVGALSDHIVELCEVTGERVIVVVDNILADPDEFRRAVRQAKSKSLPVTFVGGARTNEWNVASSDVGLVADEEFSIGGLSDGEALELCKLLERSKCLGELASLPADQRSQRLMEVHDRQLLVALHEVTSGKPLREIVLSEYRNILPPAAQVLYLDICTLHRLGVMVRAGLISRLSGIRFETFKTRFLAPLERVVSILSDWQSRDYVYKARHRDIAQIVFEEVLKNPEDRANQIARIVGSLNTDFDGDNRAASSLLKGKQLASEFSDRSLVDRIFDAAEHSGLDRSFILQQRAIFEINHPGGNLRQAMERIDEAITCATHRSSSLFHTKALVLKALARSEGIGQTLRGRYLQDALELLRSHGGLKFNYSAGTICEILLTQTKLLLGELGEASHRLSDEATLRKMTELERALAESLQRFPEDYFLTNIRADLHLALSEQPKAIALLSRTHEKQPSNELIALRLARQYVSSGNAQPAISVLRRTTSLVPGSKPINFELASLLIANDEHAHLPEIAGLLRRSFSDGDSNFEAQFWFARHEFLFGDKTKAERIYSSFSTRAHPYVDTAKRRAPARGPDGTPQRFDGSITSLKGDFAFVSCSQLGSSLYLHRTEMKDDCWPRIRVGDRLRFKVGFSFRGPACIDALPA